MQLRGNFAIRLPSNIVRFALREFRGDKSSGKESVSR